MVASTVASLFHTPVALIMISALQRRCQPDPTDANAPVFPYTITQEVLQATGVLLAMVEDAATQSALGGNVSEEAKRQIYMGRQQQIEHKAQQYAETIRTHILAMDGYAVAAKLKGDELIIYLVSVAVDPGHAAPLQTPMINYTIDCLVDDSVAAQKQQGQSEVDSAQHPYLHESLREIFNEMYYAEPDHNLETLRKMLGKVLQKRKEFVEAYLGQRPMLMPGYSPGDMTRVLKQSLGLVYTDHMKRVQSMPAISQPATMGGNIEPITTAAATPPQAITAQVRPSYPWLVEKYDANLQEELCALNIQATSEAFSRQAKGVGALAGALLFGGLGLLMAGPFGALAGAYLGTRLGEEAETNTLQQDINTKFDRLRFRATRTVCEAYEEECLRVERGEFGTAVARGGEDLAPQKHALLTDPYAFTMPAYQPNIGFADPVGLGGGDIATLSASRLLDTPDDPYSQMSYAGGLINLACDENGWYLAVIPSMLDELLQICQCPNISDFIEKFGRNAGDNLPPIEEQAEHVRIRLNLAPHKVVNILELLAQGFPEEAMDLAALGEAHIEQAEEEVVEYQQKKKRRQKNITSGG
jgi:hypothetical protein